MKKYTFLLFVLVSLSISAQNISTGYHSNSFGLRSSSNPSAFPETKFVLGFPGLSNLNIGLQVPLSLNETFFFPPFRSVILIKKCSCLYLSALLANESKHSALSE